MEAGMTGQGTSGNGKAAPKIAIVGMAALFPGESGTTGFWRTIARGEDAIGDVPAHYWHAEDYYDADPSAPDKTYCNRGGFIDKVAFDTLKFGVPPSVMKATDTAQLLALMTASEVLDAVEKSQAVPLDRSRTGVVLGVASATELAVHLGSRLQRPIWANALREHGMAEEDVTAICDRICDHFVPWQEASFPGLLGNVVAGRIANRLDLGGANFVTDAACASSLSALQAGLQQLYLGDADLVIAGGVDALNDILMFMCFSKTPAFSKSGDCRPFSDQADGTILGEGVAMFALRRLEDAERDGNEIYAVVTGLGAASDGRATSVYAPRPEGQALAIRRAYEAAGYDPATVEMVEAHGTGTKAGDAAEFGGLRLAFGTDGARRQSIALGSVKSQIGHTKAAAGSAGLFKAAMALHHGVMPPTIKVERPNPNLKLEESPFFINTELRPWIRGKDHPRRAAVSSFGFGGSNFHVALEEYRGPGKRARKRRHHDCELLLVSAETPAGLDRALSTLVERAAAVDLSRLACDSHAGFDANHPCRVSLVAASTAGLADQVAKAREQIAKNVKCAPIAGGGRVDLAPAEAGRVAFVFPGQGSQYVGMGGGVATAFEHARRVWDKAADLVAIDGAALHDAVFPPPAFTGEARAEHEARLTRMAFAQPAIAATEASMLALLGALGVRAHCFAGHSFGEVIALHAAGAYGLDSALGIAAERGRLMTEAAKSTEGAMLAVAAGHDAVAALVAELRLDVVLANDNSPQQVVLSGRKASIAEAEAALRQRGLNVTVLPVATGFHSPIVAGSVAPFQAYLAGQGLVAPGRPVYANATAAPYPADARSTEETLAGQLGQAVRFRESIERMFADGVRVFVEVGPGSVLTSLVRQCLGDRPHRAIALDRKGARGLAAFWQGIGDLALAGVTVDLRPLWDEAPAEPEMTRPTGAHVFEIDGVNVGKPYPARKTVAGVASPSRPVAAAPSPTAAQAGVAHDGKALFQSFQALLEEQRKHLETTLMDAHRAHVESSSAAFLAMFGADRGGAAVVSAAPAASVPAPIPVPATFEMRAPEPAVAPAAPPVVAAKPPQGPAAAPVTAMLRLVESIVSEKTGYPAEVLGHDMDLEAELGIDSIKQVEILSALRDRMPELPEIEPSALARFRTIAAIASMIGGHAPAPAAPAIEPAPAPAFIEAPPLAPDVLPVEPVVATGGDDALLRLVEAIVSEKTGYPAEVLGHDMDLEAELGIDSIKQVEILSALRDRMPGLPEIEPSALARFRTIAAIAGMIGGHAPAPAPSAAVPAPPAALPVVTATAPMVQAAIAAPAQDAVGSETVLRLVEAIVAEKTGYPVEVLGHDMDLEAELGIDSIKQVEILSALRDRMPGLPEIEPSALARFRTIAAIAGMIASGDTPAAAATPPPPAASAPAPAPVAAVVTEAVSEIAAPAPGHDGLLRLVEAIVSEKTGYPVEVLGHDMDLEAELGIDSIKQVEILSALRDRMPGLPEIEPSALARFRTIAAIAGMIAAKGGPADVPPPPPGASAPVPIARRAATNPLGREVYEMVASPASGLILPNVARAASVTLAGGPTALREALARRFGEREVAVVAASDDMVVFLGGLDGGASATAALDLHRAAFEAAKAAACAFGAKGGAFIAVQDCGGDFGYGGGSLDRPWFGGVTGLVKTAAREWPAADVKAIDITTAGRPAEAIADLILAELYAGGPEIEVAYDAGGLRAVPVRRSRPLEALAGLPLDDGDVVIVTGGARGVTAAAATALAGEKRLRLCLLGRSPVLDEAADLAGADTDVALRQRLVARATERGQYPDLLAIRREAAQVLASREIVATLAAIRAAGSDARYIRCDVNDAASVNVAFAEIRRDLGPVAGLIHGAGVIADKAIADKPVADFEAVYRTKVGAFATLLDALGRDPLKVLCNFSSVSAKFGNSGQADYAMANETLNKLAIAYARANPACRVKSICWGPWEGGMVDASLRRHFEKAGVGMIALDAGARALVEELSSDDASVEVVLREGDFLPEGNARMSVDLDPVAYPFLADHRITGDAVLPVAMVQEWFARAVRTQAPDAGSLSVEDLSVLRGIVLSGFPTRRYRFDIEIEAAGDRRAFTLKLRDADGQPRYATRAVPHADRIAAASDLSAATVSGPLAPAPVYGDHRLFHGPAFQTLHRVDPMTDEGGTAVIGSTHDRAWPGSAWAADPAAIDGCLQLALLWGQEKMGAMTLPGRIGSCRIFRQARPGETYTCRMWSRAVDDFRSEHDIDLMLDGELAIALSGVEMYRTKADIAA